MSDHDYDIDELPCPVCDNPYTHYRFCCECEDGFIDEHEDDPINFAPGESLVMCRECYGEGIERWCPKCGADYWKAKEGLVTSD